MCGRYRLSRLDELLEFLEAEAEEPEGWKARYNIAPSQTVPVIRAGGGKTVLGEARWGLIPRWAKDEAIGHRMINARSETVLSKPSFKKPFLERRCLVPADGFYEWKKEGAKKQPYCFTMKDGSAFAFAGIGESWTSPEGRTVESCSILTTSANRTVAEVHDRMPVILPRRHYHLWLNAPPAQSAPLTELLVPFDPALMEGFAVSTAVNSPRNEGPELARRV